ncbi:hypothetical protein [Luteolibacter marinus]|uniref:hypothetical protein n=1 Tax=Luteolibacter marinus TaxID=2776705 RepID=UPI001865ED70|nr:hypothetical protein [Luteolibacter marinus]
MKQAGFNATAQPVRIDAAAGVAPPFGEGSEMIEDPHGIPAGGFQRQLGTLNGPGK